MRKIRIGIDVGGTFTHAVGIDNDSYKLIGKVKIPTTHTAEEGVARGIISALNKLLTEVKIIPEEVVFIAHSTTQATNALLEGDVARVGIVGMGKGLEGRRAKSETNIEEIELTQGKFLKKEHYFLDTELLLDEEIIKAIKNLKNSGCEVIVAAEAFSVDDPQNEIKVIEKCKELGIPASGTYEISQLLGLKVRTRTAVVNASILPKMMETANMTEEAVKASHFSSPLMIMRSDGGVMDIKEMRHRPILTILSGPAAGVAAALMHLRISNGIFLEVGGTSTDISCIYQGKPMIKPARIGGHTVYLHTLDVRTVGLAGGSLPRIKNNKIFDVGPRSAHIANLSYVVFSSASELEDAEVIFISTKEGDPADYLAFQNKQGKRFALTPTCCANFLGLIKEGDYGYGNVQAVNIALKKLAHILNSSPEEIANKILEVASQKIILVVEELIKDYRLEKDTITLVGGGGGAKAIVPYVSQRLNLPASYGEDAEVISAVGVGLALVREMVERTVINPTEDDILKLRKEAEEKIASQGADVDTIEVQIEVDNKKNILRAIATGAIEMRTQEVGKVDLKNEEILKIAAESLHSEIEHTELVGETRYLKVFQSSQIEAKLLGLIKSSKIKICVIDKKGVVKFQTTNAKVFSTTVKDSITKLKNIIEEKTSYGDGGAIIPSIFLLCRSKIIDLSGLIDIKQIETLAITEISGLAEEEPIIIIAKPRGI